ncbi:transcription termination/antitermination protein NusG [Rhizobium wenxiniae]|uniref:transcription termination/antitermination protein NusG n=1 Tax=Rhizobium wenxiniae TaxID=1737357 RepID=UPI001C6E17DF|nr:transcription termination/antitermination NusG family protein [Rhizobium wenxiniae]
MQFKDHSLAGFISVEGMLKLEKLSADEANRKACIDAATRRFAENHSLSSSWIIVHVWPGREHAVEKALLSHDIEASVPVCKGPKRRRHHKEIPPSEKPVFMGYTFVRCAHSPRAMKAILGFEHVRGIIGGWERPFPISDDSHKHFMEMAESGAYDWEVESSAIPVGSKILVKEGPFSSFEGYIVAFGGTGKGTPVVEIDIFGRKTPILIPLAMLRRL